MDNIYETNKKRCIDAAYLELKRGAEDKHQWGGLSGCFTSSHKTEIFDDDVPPMRKTLNFEECWYKV